MGQRIEDPPETPGNDCPNCTPFRWPVGETPKFVYLYFDGLVDCGWSPHPAPNGQTFKLEQVPGTPCWWHHSGDPWILNFYAAVGGGFQSTVSLDDHHGFSFFRGQKFRCPFEYSSYNNLQAACILMYAASAGICTIFWTEVITELIESFGLSEPSQLFYELFNAPAGQEVHKICNVYQRTNIKFLI